MNNNLLEVVDDGKNVRLYPLSTPILMSKTPSTHNQTMYMHDFFYQRVLLKVYFMLTWPQITINQTISHVG
jgi:hypothetical protein